MWAGFFDCLAAELDGTLPELHGGPWLHRFTVANLHFEKPRVSGAPLKVETPLLFELTLHLRNLSAGRAGHIFQSGDRMPSDGRPHFNVAAAFVRAALGLPLTGPQAASRLKSLPADVGLMSWPHEAKK